MRVYMWTVEYRWNATGQIEKVDIHASSSAQAGQIVKADYPGVTVLSSRLKE